jgi:hypothetical protein
MSGICAFLKDKIAPVHAMKAYGTMEIQLYSFLPLAVDGDGWSALCPSSFAYWGEKSPIIFKL